jgi:hypothetical protein
MSLTHTLFLIQASSLLMNSYYILGLLHTLTLPPKSSKDRISELEKMISVYQTNMDEFERIKLELSKYNGENNILKVKF